MEGRGHTGFFGRPVERPELRAVPRATADGLVASSLEGECSACGGLWKAGCACAGIEAGSNALTLAQLPSEALVARQYSLRDGRYLVNGQAYTAAGAEVTIADWATLARGREPLPCPVLRLGGAHLAGKSWAAMRLAWRLCEAGVRVRWVPVRRVVDELQALAGGRHPDAEDPVARLVARPPRVVMLDCAEASGWHRRIYEVLLQDRVERGLPTVITSALTRTELDDAVGPRLAKWLAARSEVIVFAGESA